MPNIKVLNFIYLTISFLSYTLYYSGFLAALDVFRSFWISFVFQFKEVNCRKAKKMHFISVLQCYRPHSMDYRPLCTLSIDSICNRAKIEFIRDQKWTFFHHCAPNSRENVHIRDHQSFMATFAINGKTQLKITFLYDSQKWDLHIVWWSQ